MLDVHNYHQPQQYHNDERLHKLQQLEQQLKQQQHLYPSRPNKNDENAFVTSLSLSSSPSSLSSQFSPVPTTAAIPSSAAQDPVFVAGLDSDFELFGQDYDFPMLGGNDLIMQSEPWLPQNQLTAGRSLGHHNIAHHRESSLSSLGSASAGPASPFSQNTSNPHIAVSDSVGDGYSTMASYYDDPSLQLVKPSAAGAQDGFYNAGHAAYASPDGLPVPPNAYGSLLAAHRQKGGVASSHSERGLQPPPDLSIGSNRSQPASVASSIASNSPATPSLDQADDDARRRNGENHTGGTPLVADDEAEEFPFIFDGVDDEDDECSRFFDTVAFHAPPKLDRTMTDVYNDELYSQNFPMPPTSQSASVAHLAASPNNEMFTQRLQQMNNQHLSAASHQAPVTTGASRDRSPFRHVSPMAQAPSHDFSSSPVTNMRFSSQQQQQRQQQQRGSTGADASQAFRSQVARSQDTATPQTISPKDAVLEYHEPDVEGDAANYSLFAQTNPQGFSMDQMSKAVSQMGQSYPSMTGAGVGTGSSFSYMTPQLGQALQMPQQIPQQYPFIAQHHASPAVTNASTTHSPVPAMRPVASSIARSGLVEPVPNSQRPGITADGGTYTCTYHGCTQRFETPALLQKHKREGHRQANALAGTRKMDGSMSPNLLNSQAGPHRCERINPSTGKPCNTVFSRPYDLTRHEDTIHNARKQKVRCNLCTEEKTFSRADALTRHFRVCHPDVEFPGKHRKRGVHAN